MTFGWAVAQPIVKKVAGRPRGAIARRLPAGPAQLSRGIAPKRLGFRRIPNG
jgi:hypothetical protein